MSPSTELSPAGVRHEDAAGAVSADAALDDEKDTRGWRAFLSAYTSPRKDSPLDFPAEGSSAAAADPLTEVAETDVTATCDSDEEGGLQVSGGSLEDVYEVGEVLGRGHFAVVTSGRHRVTGETVAIKTIKKGSTNVRSEVGEPPPPGQP